MPDHTIFNERPESQDRALKAIERLGYQRTFHRHQRVFQCDRNPFQ